MDSSWIETLVREIDDSPYSLEEWIDALLKFSEWEQFNQRILPLEQKRQYLGCCIEGLKTQSATIRLGDALDHYLKINGVV